jgi:RNA polymerase sigma-70 factor (ECF subfamily)
MLDSDTNTQESALQENILIDKALIARVLNGDKKAFDLLVLKYQQRMANAVYPYVKDRHEVYDVVQESFIKAYKNLSLYRGDSAFYSWLYRIAINTSKNHLMTAKRRPPKQDIDFSEVDQHEKIFVSNEMDSPERLLSHSQLTNQVMQLIDDLSDELKQVIRMKEQQGLNYEQISKQLNCPVGTVKSRLFRAREILSSKVKKML